MVSVIVPCYNQASYLEEALASVLRQEYQEWECIIVNDGSTDATATISKKWIKKDKRFKYLEQENSGVVAARNNGIKQAVGDYVLPLDADDKIGKEYLAKALGRFKNNEKLKLVYCEGEYFGELEKKWDLPEFTLQELATRNIIFNCAMFKKIDWERIGGYDANCTKGLEDWEFWIHLLKDGGEVYKIPKVCFYYRQVGNSRNVSITLQQYKEIYEYLSLKHTAFFVEHLGSFKFLYEKLKKLERQNTRLEKQIKANNNTLTMKRILKLLIRRIK
ncbi:MAG: glycosyl transferase family 2 [Aequorivita sp.]|nr:MAG: glycosyl transferase family 2 [Aequorivita sp.]